MSSPAQPEWRNKRAQASGRYGKRPGAFGFFFPPTHPGRCPSAGSSMELRRFTLKQRQTFIYRVNELQGQATTLEVSTVVVLHSRIDEARQAAWPGRRGCTPRPSQPSQLRRRLTTRLVGSRMALRITEIPPGILTPVRYGTTRTRTGFRRVPRSRNPLESGSSTWLLKA